ncbi:hypothetical protein [Streptomyces sp. NPDC001843]|uniref:hypothetical protein n=1 Tax=Streptomyces sp. NPDC001843 TaxID=3364617 RepID=UPI0036B7067C
METLASLILFGIVPFYAIARAGVRGFDDGFIARLPAKIALLLLLPLCARLTGYYADQQHAASTCDRYQVTSVGFVALFLTAFCLVMAVNRALNVGGRLRERTRALPLAPAARTTDRVLGSAFEVLVVGTGLDVLTLGRNPLLNGLWSITSPIASMSGGLLGGYPDWLSGPIEAATRAGFSDFETADAQCPHSPPAAGFAALIMLLLLLPAVILACDPLANARFTWERYQIRPRYLPHACTDCEGYGVHVRSVLRFASVCGNCRASGIVPPQQWQQNFRLGAVWWAYWRLGVAYFALLIAWLVLALVFR